MSTRPDTELAEFSERLLHNTVLYFRLSRVLTRARIGIDAPQPWETATAQVESFAMHTRGLADFFYKFRRSPNFPDDALALDYFASGSTWQKLIGLPGPWLQRVWFRPERYSPEELVDRFGEQIAHLNYHALPLSDFARGWPVMQLAAEIGRAVAIFSAEVEPAKVVAGFRTKVWREIPVTAKTDDPRLFLAAWTRPSLRGTATI